MSKGRKSTLTSKRPPSKALSVADEMLLEEGLRILARMIARHHARRQGKDNSENSGDE